MRKLSFLLLLICLAKESSAQITYKFTGNGNWTVLTNWSNNIIPPVILPAGDTIIVSPAVGDSCVLSTSQTILFGGSLVIASGAIFIVRDGMMTHETKVEITVRDGNSWTTSNTTMNVVSGATIKIYETQTAIINNSSPKYTVTTDQSGKASLPVDFRNLYFFTVQKGNAKNVINGLLIIGIFQTQSEIQSSPYQTPNPTIGSPKFLDTDGDGIIRSPMDNIYGDYINLIQNQTVAKTSIIYQ